MSLADHLRVAALGYVESDGWALLPLVGKRPAVGRDWQRKASSDPAQIGRWLSRGDVTGIGVYLPSAGLVVADLDRPEDIEAMVVLGLNTTTGRVARSGRVGSGFHVYRTLQEPWTAQTWGNPTIRGVMVRANGICVLPPSIHPDTGRPYTWVVRGDIKPLPQAVIDARGEASTSSSTGTAAGRHGALLRTAIASVRERWNTGERDEKLLTAVALDAMLLRLSRVDLSDGRVFGDDELIGLAEAGVRYVRDNTDPQYEAWQSSPTVPTQTKGFVQVSRDLAGVKLSSGAQALLLQLFVHHDYRTGTVRATAQEMAKWCDPDEPATRKGTYYRLERLRDAGYVTYTVKPRQRGPITIRLTGNSLVRSVTSDFSDNWEVPAEPKGCNLASEASKQDAPTGKSRAHAKEEPLQREESAEGRARTREDEAAFLAELCETFDAVQVDPPCRYPAHRGSDWVARSGKVICGVCYPPAPGAAVSAALPLPAAVPDVPHDPASPEARACHLCRRYLGDGGVQTDNGLWWCEDLAACQKRALRRLRGGPR